jgi:hypothetical protein
MMGRALAEQTKLKVSSILRWSAFARGGPIIGRNFMRTLNISMAAVAVLFLSSTITATQAASGAGVTSAAPRLSTTNTTYLYLAAKKKKHWKSYGYHCPPGQAKKFRC